MIVTDELYPDAFFKGRSRYNWRAPIVCQSLVDMYRKFYGKEPVCVADLGCAIGDLVQGFLDLGMDPFGFEGSEAARLHIVCPPDRWGVLDLRKPISDDDVTPELLPFDFITCFEVAEHLEPECANMFVRNLTDLSPVCVTSACPPHPTRKATKYHLNEQHPQYWDEKFGFRGFFRRNDIEAYLKECWFPWRKKYGIAAFYQNLLVYTAGGE